MNHHKLEGTFPCLFLSSVTSKARTRKNTNNNNISERKKNKQTKHNQQANKNLKESNFLATKMENDRRIHTSYHTIQAIKYNEKFLLLSFTTGIFFPLHRMLSTRNRSSFSYIHIKWNRITRIDSLSQFMW